MKEKCPYCNKEFKRLGTHFYNCKELQNYSEDEIHIINLKYQTNNDNIIEDICNDYQNNLSLTDINKKYKLCFGHICWILNYKHIHIRTLSESYKKIVKHKNLETCRKKYGVDNPSQVKEIKDKKAATFMKHYGVDNIWKTKEYAEFTSKRWASYNKEKKSELIHKWTKQEGRISKLENKIVNILNELNIPIETQFKFSKYFHKYDILIKNTNIIIEVQGDYWHANPIRYKSNDIITFPGGKQYTAEQLWKKDLQKIHYAESQNYKVIQIWESEIYKQENENNLEIYLLDILSNYISQTN